MSTKLKTVTVAGFGLGIQGWAGQSLPDPEKLSRPARSTGPESKPPKSFFTSTLDQSTNSTKWLDYLRDNNGQRANEGRCLWALTPCPQATLYIVNSLEDYKQLADAYPKTYENRKNPCYAPDWYQIGNPSAIPFDGVHVTEKAIASGNSQQGYPKFWGWNVESTLWLVWRFKNVEKIGPLGDDWTLAN